MEALAIVIAAGLLARAILNMRKQNRLLLDDVAALDRNVTETRNRCAALLRRVRKQRDAAMFCLETAGDEYQELHEAHEELLTETAVYRAEDARRERAVRARLN